MTPLVLISGMMCDARKWRGLPNLLYPREVGHLFPTEADTVQTLAAQVLRQAPHRVTHLALLDTNPRAELPATQANRAQQVTRALSGDLDGVLRDEMKPNYLHPGRDRAEILDLCMDMALSLGPEIFARQSRALANRPDQTQTLAAFKGPALVLMGEGDKLCPRERHDQMHGLMPQSCLAIIPNAGHLPTLEQPALTAAELLRWLTQPERTTP